MESPDNHLQREHPVGEGIVNGTRVDAVLRGFAGCRIPGDERALMLGMFTAEETQRYSRQLSMPEFGAEGQQKLHDARVLVIGAGGLGCPAAIYLAAAGVGTLGIVEFDRVDLTNIHRQILYNSADVGARKLDVARDRIVAANPNVSVECFDTRLTSANAIEVIQQFDLV